MSNLSFPTAIESGTGKYVAGPTVTIAPADITGIDLRIITWHCARPPQQISILHLRDHADVTVLMGKTHVEAAVERAQEDANE